jgi:hypothetical protein
LFFIAITSCHDPYSITNQTIFLLLVMLLLPVEIADEEDADEAEKRQYLISTK